MDVTQFSPTYRRIEKILTYIASLSSAQIAEKFLKLEIRGTSSANNCPATKWLLRELRAPVEIVWTEAVFPNDVGGGPGYLGVKIPPSLHDFIAKFTSGNHFQELREI